MSDNTRIVTQKQKEKMFQVKNLVQEEMMMT